MNNIYLYIDNIKINTDLNNIFNTNIDNNNLKIYINIYSLSNYYIYQELLKVKSFINIYNKTLNTIYIKFNININTNIINKILTKINDIIYVYYPITYKIKLHKINLESKYLMKEIINYKNLIMNPNKNPDIYLNYIINNIPDYYDKKIFNLDDNNNKLFPLTQGVGNGSIYNSYFVHIFPKIEDPNKKNIYLIGKSITYDTGGLNIKNECMESMKIDIIGSGILISTLKILNNNNIDKKYNIHLLCPIAENMLSNKSIKPGITIKTMSNKIIEVNNIDAEGRLCIVDALDYINMNLIKDKDPNNCLILDIATLTGNTQYITSYISGLITCNNKGIDYKNNIINIGDDIGEYLDYIKLREEYLEDYKSKVADIKNLNINLKTGFISAGAFINYFCDKNIPWLHIDVASCSFVKEEVTSYGINLLYEFIKNLN
jgi:leucyl aminopeptidase